MGPIGYLETSLRNYHSSLRHIAEEGRSHLHGGGRLTPRRFYVSVLRTAKITQRWRQITERLLSTGGMILAMEYGSTQRKTCPLATLYTTNPKETGLALKPGLRAAMTVTNLLNRKEAFNIP